MRHFTTMKTLDLSLAPPPRLHPALCVKMQHFWHSWELLPSLPLSLCVGVDVVISGSQTEVFRMCAGSPDNGSDYSVPYSQWPWIKGLLSVREGVLLCENISCSKRIKSERRSVGGGTCVWPGRKGPRGVWVSRDVRPVWGLHANETSQTSTRGERSG